MKKRLVSGIAIMLLCLPVQARNEAKDNFFSHAFTNHPIAASAAFLTAGAGVFCFYQRNKLMAALPIKRQSARAEDQGTLDANRRTHISNQNLVNIFNNLGTKSCFAAGTFFSGLSLYLFYKSSK